MTPPRTRADCLRGERPCPEIQCRYNLRVIIRRSHGTGRQGRGRIPAEVVLLPGLPDSCALDVADRGGCTLEHIASIWGLTRERVRQIEAIAIRKLRHHPAAAEGTALRDLSEAWSERSAKAGEHEQPQSLQWKTQARRTE